MSLLFDQNLSRRLPSMLGDIYPASRHVSEFGLDAADDTAIWIFARREALAILSKDDDFRQRSLLYGQPPKAIGVRLGNCSTAEIARLLRSECEAVRRFLRDDTVSFLALP
ncbi:MAG: DUF5615 family PIN-like protein [Phycisphaeraceae bacterium]|nr:DUF5615 family PIN-like protein [Phycisphaeraceae bacterium]MCW5755155.1 DUF5615 family PIN-like protein [Phycisphaeraceae bacterium]